ncbi:MAG: FapA family protein [Sulfuricurvum sp.]|nr:FapA family protein [Sulfuricurvum sp.]
MGLFTNQGKHEETIPQIKPIVVRTSNVAKELLQVSSNHQIHVNSLDFNLLDIQTLSRTLLEGSGTQEDWKELSEEDIRKLGEDSYLNQKFELKQVYEIEIYAKSEATMLDLIDMSIGGNSTLCKIYLTIKAGSEATYYETFKEDFLKLIDRKKLRANMMIGLFDSMLQQNLADLLAKIKIEGSYRFEVQERYVIGVGYEPVATVNDKLVLHYETKRKNLDEHGRINYAKRGYIMSAVANELLMEYIKPQMGEHGRNCRGEYLVPKAPIVKNEPTFTVGEKIAVIDTPTSIEYRAKASGYVTLEGGMYDIKTEVDVSEISFRTTGSIETQLDADVLINVTEKDVLKDAIGMGMDVTVNVINIEGNIGPNAKVTAHKATIEGQVHQSAIITADELTINIHKGTAHGKEVNITRLEHGIVEAETVKITQATGGKIRAKDISIEILGSHVQLTASHKIEIKSLQGGENLFIIDPLLNESMDVITEQMKKIEEVTQSLKEINRELTGYEMTWKENVPVMEELKNKLIHYKQNGVKAPTAFVQKYQQLLQFKQKLDALRDEMKQKEDMYKLLSSKHTALQNEIFEARIINHDRWRNHNEIIFKLIDPPIDVMYVPSHNSDEKILGLHKDEFGEYSIRKLEE